ncbi:PREDICTED: probable fatty acyl-CoA reductase 4 isoform X1 [Theobroma cacao]|uniref:Fatty acyl-CoA reductase n=1 Tax=Theobroma cacao TaxID=3641 RepID=A0AB32WNU2_THECC|nr:PREDICTED: probable fatty acyl-CoA reductase 4 isoform X1 [Theobroma cacao]
MNMELDHVVKFLQGKTILVTGATGFLAKIFVEKILRIQPNVNKLYLLLKAADAKSATKRLHSEIIDTELFTILRDNWGSEFDSFILTKVIAVPGDISSENLGVNESKLREQMLKEIEIVVHVAATTGFNESYDVALAINTFGALNVLSFAKKCDKIKLFLHTSTAYVCGEEAGIILEKPFSVDDTLLKTCKLDIIEEKRIVEEKLDELRFQHAPNEVIKSEMKEFGLKRAKLYGWPNTYVFTKAMGEMLLGNFKGDLPFVIIRPTMIASTYKEPFPGWIEGVRTIDSVIVSYGKGKLTCFPGYPNSALDVIPADMVVNAMVVAMSVHTSNQSCQTIYHVSSSLKNPLKLGDFCKFIHCYFTENPWSNRNGQRVKVRKLTVLSTINGYFLYMWTKYVFPLKVLYLVNILSCQYFRQVYMDLNRKIKFAMRLAEFYKPYAFFKGNFSDTNLDKLRMVAQGRGIDMGVFDFDSKSIDWEDYMMNIHIPGLLRHAI